MFQSQKLPLNAGNLNNMEKEPIPFMCQYTPQQTSSPADKYTGQIWCSLYNQNF